MPVRIKYEANNSDFRKLMLSGQTQDLADQGAKFGVLAARAYAAGTRPALPADYIASIRATTGPIVTIGDGTYANPRRTARVVAEHRLAGAIEFGTGVRSVGAGAGAPRSQGGYSEPYRILGRTGARIGSPPKKAR